MSDLATRVKRLSRNLIPYALAATTALSPGCGGKKEKITGLEDNPTLITQPIEVRGESTKVFSGLTNENGLVSFIDSNTQSELIAETRDAITLKPIEGIVTNFLSNPSDNSGVITFEDTTGNHLSEVQYISPSSGKLATAQSRIFTSMNPVSDAPFVIRAQKNIPEYLDKSEYDLLGTFPLSDIAQVYEENDFFARNTSIIEFLSERSTYPPLVFLSAANKARNTFLERSVEITRAISDVFGGTMDPDAMYWDIYRVKVRSLPIVTKRLNTQDRLCTVKGAITDKENNPLNDVNVSVGHNRTSTNEEGNYRLTHVIGGRYNVRFEKEGFEPLSLDTLIQPVPYPDFISTRIDPSLEQEIIRVQPLTNQIIWHSNGNIYKGSPDGSFSERILIGEEPSLSPNGIEIAYNSGNKIFIADINGGHVELLIDRSENNKGGPWGPIWSSSGDQIAFYERVGDGFSNDIFLVDRKDKKVSRLTHLETDIRDISWGNPRYLIFSAPYAQEKEIQRLDIETGTTTVLTEENGTNKYSPKLNPDGTQLVFSEWTTIPPRRNWLGFTIAEQTYKSEICVLDMLTNKKTYLTRDEKTHWPSWSYDGSRIIFSRYNGGDYDLFTIDKEGRNLIQVTDTRGASEIYPIWSHF